MTRIKSKLTQQKCSQPCHTKAPLALLIPAPGFSIHTKIYQTIGSYIYFIYDLFDLYISSAIQKVSEMHTRERKYASQA